MREVDGGTLGLSMVVIVAAFFLWDTPLLLPLKLFVVLLHEISHGLAAVLTGGELVRLEVVAQEGGAALTRGGSRVAILSAGYLGSALWGAFFLRLSVARPQRRRAVLLGMGVVLVVVALFYARDLFTFVYVAVAAGALLLLSRRAPPGWQRVVLFIVGTLSCLYAVVDIGTDVLAGGPLAWLFGPRHLNDAEMLASITWIPAFVWGLLWSALAIIVYIWTVLAVSRER